MKLASKMYFKALGAKAKVASLLKNEKGETNIIALILILAVVILLAILFKDAIYDLFKDLWSNVTGNADTVGSETFATV